VEQAFIRILGLKPLYFRPPYGSINDLVLQVLGSRGYKSASDVSLKMTPLTHRGLPVVA
jgi:peptidoglycan/xylan/chitin deacetylase (PgdA/CDA1 family)